MSSSYVSGTTSSTYFRKLVVSADIQLGLEFIDENLHLKRQHYFILLKSYIPPKCVRLSSVAVEHFVLKTSSLVEI